MSDETNNDKPRETTAPTEAPVAPQQEPAPQGSDPAAELEALRAEHAAVKDRLLRALAEMENLRRRTEREVADAKTYGIASFARDSVALADNLRRALDSFPAEARAAMEPDVAARVEASNSPSGIFSRGWRDSASRRSRRKVPASTPISTRRCMKSPTKASRPARWRR